MAPLCITWLLLLTVIGSAVGDKLYNISKEICCDDRIHSRPNDTSGYRCCGSQMMTPGFGVCCNDKPIKYPDNVTEQYFNWGCCGDDDSPSIYNFRTQLCCDGHVVDVDGKTPFGCCKKDVFDFRKGLCCDGVIHNVDHRGELGCCGQQVFNFSTQLCCSQLSRDHKSGDFDAEAKFALHDLPKELHGTLEVACCNLDIFKPRTEVCCEGGPQPKPANMSEEQSWGCCGNTPIKNPATEICCDDKVRLRDTPDQWCCGDQLVRLDREFCCGRRIFPLSSNSSCCWNTDQIYDPAKQVCCRDKIVDIPRSDGHHNNNHTLHDVWHCCG